MCIVYDLTQTNSLDRVSKNTTSVCLSMFCWLSQVTSYWLPLIKQHSHGVCKPVILVGNKVKLKNSPLNR